MELRNNRIASHSDIDWSAPTVASLLMGHRWFADLAIKTAGCVMPVHGDVKWIKGIQFSFAFATRAHNGLQILTGRAYDGFVLAVELAHVLTLVFVIRSQRQGIAAASRRKT